MLVQKIDDLDRYAEFLKNTPGEAEALFTELLIHVTGFFRDKNPFEVLKTRVFPKYMKDHGDRLPYRIWVPGCSTGEEVYSLAMCFIEFQDKQQDNIRKHFEKYPEVRGRLSIFGTDISEQALQKARTAVYPATISNDVSKERLERFFDKQENGGYRIVKWLRDACVFSRHDVTRDPPFAKLDLISCRNVLIYFDPELQGFVLPLFHYALNPGGILLLGQAMSVGLFNNLFNVVDSTNKIYSKVSIKTPFKFQIPIGRISRVKWVSETNSSAPVVGCIDLQKLSDQTAANEYAPPSVLLNEALEIVHSRGKTTPFLNLSPGYPSYNILRMVHPDLTEDLREAVGDARKKQSPILREGLCIHDNIGFEKGLITLAIKVVPIQMQAESKERYVMVFFQETRDDSNTKGGSPARTRKKGEQIKDLQYYKNQYRIEMQKKIVTNLEYQRSVIEEYETSQEELLSSNEELQSINEEFQSTNEELETTKEELQSSNEELSTVNTELEIKNTEVVTLNNDLINLISCVDIPIIIIDLDRNIRRFTPMAAKVLKLIPTDLGRPLGDIKPNIQIADFEQLVIEVIETKKIKEVETQDHRGYWYSLKVMPYVTDQHGKVDGAVLLLLDIDSQKRNIESLKKAASDLKKSHDDTMLIIESLPIPLLVVDSKHEIKLASRIFYDKFRVTNSETEGKNICELLSNQLKSSQLYSLIESTLNEGVEFNGFEVRYDFSHIGRKIMSLSSRRVELLGSGEISALIVLEDITKQINSSEDKYKTLIDSASLGIVIVREDGMIDFANRQVLKLFGYDSKEIMNQTIEILIPDRFRHAHLAQRANYAAHLVTREMGENGERLVDLVGKRKNGVEFPVEVSLSPITTPSGTFVTAMIRDISDRRELESQRASLLLKEKESNLVKDQFLATLSHELRTPLTTILAWAQILSLGMVDEAEAKHGIAVIESNANAQAQLIDDLLDISRIQAGKILLNLHFTDLIDVIRVAQDTVQFLANKKSIQIELLLAPVDAIVIADPTRLHQIFWNLLSNAIKFTPQNGKIIIKLESLKTPTEELIEVKISDTGKGIKADFLPHIFERFTQADCSTTRTFGGLGLGMAIVKSLIDMQGGKIKAESPGESKGSTFTISFPLHKRITSTRDKIQTIRGPSTGKIDLRESANLNGIHILFVDDDADAREALAVILSSFGAKIEVASSAAEGLKLFLKSKPDILISDIAMPDEDGYSFITRIRALSPNQGGAVPALALTAFAGADDVKRLLEQGFDAHLAKPVDITKLSQAISELGKSVQRQL